MEIQALKDRLARVEKRALMATTKVDKYKAAYMEEKKKAKVSSQQAATKSAKKPKKSVSMTSMGRRKRGEGAVKANVRAMKAGRASSLKPVQTVRTVGVRKGSGAKTKLSKAVIKTSVKVAR